MPSSIHRTIKNSFEFLPVEDITRVPNKVRGIYVLYKSLGKKKMNVVYVGMARGEASGIKGRLIKHRKNKPDLWTHFSAFEVWDNISAQEVEELEGLFRHIYRYDTEANSLNAQGSHKPLDLIRRKSVTEWK
jgi:hypothetical protein